MKDRWPEFFFSSVAMTSFDDLIASDAPFFVDPDRGGVSIEAISPSGVSRPINVNIIWGAPRETEEASKIFAAKIDVEAINNAVTGLSTAGTELIGTRLKIPQRKGHATLLDITIRQESVVKQDGGLVYLSF